MTLCMSVFSDAYLGRGGVEEEKPMGLLHLAVCLQERQGGGEEDIYDCIPED